MATAFRDIVLRLTEASLTADQILPEEAAALYAEAARTIQELRDWHAQDGAFRNPLAYDCAASNIEAPSLPMPEDDE